MESIVRRTLSVVPLGSAPAAAIRPSRALSRGIQFTKEGTQVFRDRRHKASGGGTIGKARVLPEVAEHLQQVRFAAAEKPAYPRAALTGLADIVEEGANDLLNAIRVLPLADECLKLSTQLGLRTFIAAVRNASLALIHQGMGCRGRAVGRL